MLNRILLISLIIIALVAVFYRYKANNLKTELLSVKNENAVLRANMAEYEHIFELNKKADEENEKFKGKLNEDTTDNLDFVPADYILKQLRAD